MKSPFIQLPGELQALLRAVRLGTYGEKLCDAEAIQVLDMYYENMDSRVVVQEGVPGGPDTARALLGSAADTAVQRNDSSFFEHLAKGIQKRNDPHLRDHWIVANHVLSRVVEKSISDANAGKAFENIRRSAGI